MKSVGDLTVILVAVEGSVGTTGAKLYQVVLRTRTRLVDSCSPANTYWQLCPNW